MIRKKYCISSSPQFSSSSSSSRGRKSLKEIFFACEWKRSKYTRQTDNSDNVVAGTFTMQTNLNKLATATGIVVWGYKEGAEMENDALRGEMLFEKTKRG